MAIRTPNFVVPQTLSIADLLTLQDQRAGSPASQALLESFDQRALPGESGLFDHGDDIDSPGITQRTQFINVAAETVPGPDTLPVPRAPDINIGDPDPILSAYGL